MPSLTPMRIRGKRKARKKAKLDTEGQKEAAQRAVADVPKRRSSTRSTPSTGAPSRRAKRRKLEMSRLEELPTEVLQTIFEYSANLELPLVSQRLASQLESRHLYHLLTSIILQPILDFHHGTTDQIKAAIRLMDSRFFTLDFFQSWLHEEFERRHLFPDYEATRCTGGDLGVHLTWLMESREAWTWKFGLRPSLSLPPPVKLLRGPFTGDRVDFLRMLCSSFCVGVRELEPTYVERARDAFQQAICEGATTVIHSLSLLGMQCDSESLRLAIIDAGCNRDVVEALLECGDPFAPENSVDVDFLDPALWSWAEKAQSQEDENGLWVKDLLKAKARERDERAERQRTFESTNMRP